MSSILLVDDDNQLRQSFENLLADEGYEVRAASTGEDAVAAVRDQAPDLVIMDVRMPGMSGLEAFREMRKREPKLPVIIMTAFGTTETAIEATKAGAYDYVLKPFEIPDILTLIEQALETGRLMRSRIEMDVAAPGDNVDAIIGSSEAMQEVYKAIGRAAPTDATVLIRGESGTGKELVARAIYQHSDRSEKPLLVINCVAIPETLLESELFGYEKGAFTGAVSRRIGKIEQASGGTVFLDEIGDMPVGIQAKILRLLQERSIERLGGGEPIPVDVRMIAATNRDLERAIADGRFREDLYYRLKVISIELPPLRDRIADVPQLCEDFLSRFSQELGTSNPGIADEAVTLLQGHAWPGNVRELANALQKALIFGRGCPVRTEDVSQAIAGGEAGEFSEATDVETSIRQWVRGTLVSQEKEELFTRLVDRFTAIVLAEALALAGGNRSKTAKLLGISRPTLQAKIQKHGLKPETAFRVK